MKTTAIAPSNIAFIKYWGKKNEKLRIPTNGSISMNLNNLTTTTTVEFIKNLEKDDILINGEKNSQKEERVMKHLDKIRSLAKLSQKAKVVSKNNFPASTGLSSSASAFAALTVAGVCAAGLKLSEKELSILARLGSGSASRSIPSGFTQWVAGDSNETSYSVSIFPSTYWDIADIVVILSEKEKIIPTSNAQTCAYKSPFFEKRLQFINKKIEKCKQLIKEKNFFEFGALIESEALELHAIMLTQRPPLLYWYPQTVQLMHCVWEWRSQAIPVYFTLNTGQNIHLLCEKKKVENVIEKLQSVTEVRESIVNYPAEGTRLITDHLF